MVSRIAFLICFTLALAVSLSAQTRSLTNADIEQYRQNRLKAKQEYLENYQRLGMPSPEEIDRRREQNRVETEQLSAKLRQEDLNRAALEAQLRAYDHVSDRYYSSSQVVYYPYWTNGNYFWSGWWRPRPRPPIIKHPTPHVRSGYFAGGQFWPIGLRTGGTSITPVQEANGAPR